MHRPYMIILAASILSGCSAFPRIQAPPAEVRNFLDLDPMYRKYLAVGPLPILSSGSVSDRALVEAAYLIHRMIGHRSDILEAIAASRTRFVVMAPTEFTTDIPEHSDLEPPEYWDVRARGLGATRIRPAASCGEENLLGLPGDPYATENILIHEFAHVIHEMGLSAVDPEFDGRLHEVYRAALEEGLFAGKYAATNRKEYWAEGVQSWFDTNREDDDQHNHVDTREELQEYDPRLAALCAEVFGEGDWRYVHPSDRGDRGHFRGFRSAQGPTFSWPAGKWEAYQAYLSTRDGTP